MLFVKEEYVLQDMNHVEPIISYENLPVRFFRSGDYGSFVPYHYHPALELIFITKGKLKIETPNQATSNACMKCVLPRFPKSLPTNIAELKQTTLSFSDPMPVMEADLPNQCLLNAMSANFVLINCNELHNSTCTSYNEAYVLQIPESFLEQELNYDLPLPLRFDLKRASSECLEQIAQYFLELTVAHEYCQGKLGFKVHFNHGLYGILSCLMDIMVPLSALAPNNQAKVVNTEHLRDQRKMQQQTLHKHADALLEKEPANALPGQTTVMMPHLNNLSVPKEQYTMVPSDERSTKINVDGENPELTTHGNHMGASYRLNPNYDSSEGSLNHFSKFDVFLSQQGTTDQRAAQDWQCYLLEKEKQAPDSKKHSAYISEDKEQYRTQQNQEQRAAEEKVAIALNKNMNLRRIQPVLDYLKNHYHEQIRLQDMAELIHLHPRYFCRIFKDAVGMSLLTYVSELRLCHIYNDLSEDKTPISTIMRRHGYSDSKQFYRSFKARFKLTPKEVRSMLKAHQDPIP